MFKSMIRNQEQKHSTIVQTQTLLQENLYEVNYDMMRINEMCEETQSSVKHMFY